MKMLPILILIALLQHLHAGEVTIFSTDLKGADGTSYRSSYIVDYKKIAPFMDTNLFETEFSLSPQAAYDAALTTMKKTLKKQNRVWDRFLLREIKYGNYSTKDNIFLGCPFYRVTIAVFLKPSEDNKADGFYSEYLVLPDQTVLTPRVTKE